MIPASAASPVPPLNLSSSKKPGSPGAFIAAAARVLGLARFTGHEQVIAVYVCTVHMREVGVWGATDLTRNGSLQRLNEKDLRVSCSESVISK